MPEKCTLKPNSEMCLIQINKGATTVGCGGCPISSGKTDFCCSTHSAANDTRKNHATANAISKKSEQIVKTKIPPAHSDGTGHLSNAKHFARDVTPMNMSRVKTIS